MLLRARVARRRCGNSRSFNTEDTEYTEDTEKSKYFRFLEMRFLEMARGDFSFCESHYVFSVNSVPSVLSVLKLFKV